MTCEKLHVSINFPRCPLIWGHKKRPKKALLNSDFSPNPPRFKLAIDAPGRRHRRLSEELGRQRRGPTSAPYERRAGPRKLNGGAI